MRLNMNLSDETYELVGGVTITAVAATSELLDLARLEISGQLEAEGLLPSGEDDDVDDGLNEYGVIAANRLARAVGKRVIKSWTNVEDENGNPVPVTPESVDVLLQLQPVCSAFQSNYMAKWLLVQSEGKDLPLPQSGSSVAAANIAKPADEAAQSAPD